MNLFYNPEDGRLRSGWRLFLQLMMMLFFLGVAHYLLGYVTTSPGFLAGRVPGTTAFVLSTWIAVRFLDKRSMRSLGLSIEKKWFRELGAGLAIGGLAMAFIFVLQLSLGWLSFTGFGWERSFSTFYPLPLLGYLAGMLLVGFYEELMFRGYQITNLVEGFYGLRGSSTQAAILAVAVSSLVFGIMHAGNPNVSNIALFNIMLAGVVLALPYLLTGSLALSVGLHTAWNFFQGGIFGLPVSGSPARSSLLQVRETGPDLFTGGGFGPEAGLTGIIGLLLIILLIFLYARRSSYSFTLHNNFKVQKD